MSGTLSQYQAMGIPVTKVEKAFDTYRNYLSCLKKDFGEKYSTLEHFAQSVWDEYKFLTVSTDTPDTKVLRRFLMIAWNTEYLAKTNISPEVEIIKISNQWRPIQAYYSIYSAGEAAVYILDGISVESHSKCISKLNTFFVERAKIRPWCFSYRGNKRKGFTPYNFPSDAKPINNLTRKNTKHIDIIATCIRAEHQNRIDDFEPRKLSDEQKKKGQKKALKIDHDPKYTTILNFLYRLRIKSNYKDAEIFICDSPNEYIKKFSEDLSSIVNATLVLLEMVIIKRWGFSNFEKLANGYLKSTHLPNENGNLPIKHRLEIYRKVATPSP